jgi:hypothetical protein
MNIGTISTDRSATNRLNYENSTRARHGVLLGLQ